MKTLSALLFSLILTTAAIAQPPAGQKPAGQTGQTGQAPAGQAPAQGGPGAKHCGTFQAPPSIGRAYGKVTDSTGQPMGQVSAVLLKATTDPVQIKIKIFLVKGADTNTV